MNLYKVIIRVVKSIALNEYNSGFSAVDVLREPCVEAADKKEVKEYLLNKYPQFFPTGKIYEKETNDVAQFFYVLIYPLYQFEKDLIAEGEWVCSDCGQVHENKYVSRSYKNVRLFGEGVPLCKSEDNICADNFFKKGMGGIIGDNPNYITADSPVHIYKITEKKSGKSYIGKTKNAPFFRWWDHLTVSSSPFGIYLRNSKLSD